MVPVMDSLRVAGMFSWVSGVCDWIMPFNAFLVECHCWAQRGGQREHTACVECEHACAFVYRLPGPSGIVFE